ncbi:MAG: zeta toxin family protein [Ruminococcus sp.]
MNKCVLIAGADGTGKSSFRGVLEGQGVLMGHIVDADMIAKENNFDNIKAGKSAIAEINYCLEQNISFTQETTLAGHRTKRTVLQARKQGYNIVMYYIGLNSKDESILRIQNRVRKGGHNIPEEDVSRRYEKRLSSLSEIAPLCDKVVFYDNENGFVKVAEITNNKFHYTNGYKPKWIIEVQDYLKQNCKINN